MPRSPRRLADALVTATRDPAAGGLAEIDQALTLILGLGVSKPKG